MSRLKINRFSEIIALALLIVVFGAMPLSAQAKIAFVDSKRIQDSYPAALDAQKKLDEENTKWASEMQGMDADLKAKETELDVQSLLLSEAKKKEKRNEIKLLRDNIIRFQNEKWGQSGEYFRRQEEYLRPVYDKIHEVIARVADDEGYDIILDTVQGTILYSKEKFDLTDRVITELEKETPAKKQQ